MYKCLCPSQHHPTVTLRRAAPQHPGHRGSQLLVKMVKMVTRVICSLLLVMLRKEINDIVYAVHI